MSVVVIGGTSGIGLEVARYFAGEGAEVIITGRDAARAEERAATIGARGVAVDLTRPGEIASALAGIARVNHLVLTAIERDQNTVASYDVGRAVRLVTLKLVGYAEVVHALHPAMHPASSIVMFGGLAMARPTPARPRCPRSTAVWSGW